MIVQMVSDTVRELWTPPSMIVQMVSDTGRECGSGDCTWEA